MAKLNNYSGSVELIAGIKQKGGGSFAMVEANAVQVDNADKRLDAVLEELNAGLAEKANEEHSHTITANAEDDDVVILEGTSGTNSVKYKATHKSYGLSDDVTYRSVTVDKYGHIKSGTNPTTLADYGLSDTVYTKSEVEAKIAEIKIPDVPEINYPVTSVNGKTGAVQLTASDVEALPANTPIPSIAGLASTDYVDAQIAENAYELPIASKDTLGGIKVGAGLSINNGVLSANGGGTADSVDWSGIQNKPTTVSGYGIADAYTKSEIDAELAKKADKEHTHNYLTAHPDIALGTNTTSTETPSHEGTFTAIDSITRDDDGHVTKINTKTVTLPEQYTLPDIVNNSEVTTTGTTVAFKIGNKTFSQTVAIDGGSMSVDSANKLTSAKTISLTGDASGSTTFDGSDDVSIEVTVKDDSHNHDGRYYTESEVDDLIANIAIPTVNNGTLTIKKNGSAVGTFTANQDDNKEINITVPTGAAADKGVDTSISASSTSTNLPTSKAVADFVEGKGYRITDDDTTYDLAATKSSTNGNVKLNLTAGGTGTGTDSVTIKGTGTTTVTTDANGIITVDSTAHPTTLKNPYVLDFLNSSGTEVDDYDGSSNVKLKAGNNIEMAASNGTVTISTTGLASVATSGSYNDLSNKPTIPTVPTTLKNPNSLTVKGNGTQSFTYDGSAAKTLNIKAGTNVSVSSDTSGNITISATDTTDYNSLSNKPTIPTVNNGTLTIQKNGTTVKTFTANSDSDVTADITVPTKVSELENDKGYLTTYTDTNTTYSLTSSTHTANGKTNLKLWNSDNSDTDQVHIKGTGATTVTSDANGVIEVNTDAYTVDETNGLFATHDVNETAHQDIRDAIPKNITENDSGMLEIADESSNVVFRVDKEGAHAPDVIVEGGSVSELITDFNNLEEQVAGLTKIYVQKTEPENAEVNSLWVDTDDELTEQTVAFNITYEDGTTEVLNVMVR